jgi:phage terminase large subunit
VGSGHKIGKSALAIMIASWKFCCFADARVVMTSTTAPQVDRILWRELRMMWARAGRCDKCKEADPDGTIIQKPCPHSVIIPEADDLPELARTGVQAADFRQMFGFSSKEAEAVAGISGRDLTYIVDEASGVPDVIFEAIEGNMMAGAKLIMFSNCTRNEGRFFDAFYSKSEFWKTHRVSSEDTPNCTGKGKPIPGLADPEMIAEYEREHGRDSAWFKIRVLGQHALHDEGRIFSVGLIVECEDRLAHTEPEGRLVIGVDPAGASGKGDDATFCPRRGPRQCAPILERKGLDGDGHLSVVRELIRDYQGNGGKALVVVDGGGEVGVKAARALRAARDDGEFDLVVLHMSDGATRDVAVYDRMRDLLAGILLAWMKAGGAIYKNTKLQQELHLWEWRVNKAGKQKLFPEKDGADGVRRLLGRSCDRYDGLALSCYEPTVVELKGSDVPQAAQDPYEQRAGGEMDPQARHAEWDGSNTGSNWQRGLY